MVTVNIIENNGIPEDLYQAVKKDYMEPEKITYMEIINKYQITQTTMTHIREKIYEETGYARRKNGGPPTYKKHLKKRNRFYWVYNGEDCYGRFRDRKIAIHVIKYLEKEGWNLQNAKEIIAELKLPLYTLFNNKEMVAEFEKDYANMNLTSREIKNKWGLTDNQYYHYARRKFPNVHRVKRGQNYSKENGLWKVTKTIQGEAYYYGHYKDEKTAQQVVYKLQEHEWNPEALPKIKEELGL